jgi:hypothetical protein
MVKKLGVTQRELLCIHSIQFSVASVEDVELI